MKRTKDFIISLAILIFWMSIIYWYSSCNADVSRHQSGDMVGIGAKLLSYLTGNRCVLDLAILSKLDHIIRKSAHFFIFFVLGFLTINFFGYCDKIRHKFIVSILFCAFYAVSDEFHQYFVPGRAALNKDLIIDIYGSVCGITLNILLKKHCKKRTTML